jgi:cytochrome o ubiquinol oxidase operon protein cyoD
MSKLEIVDKKNNHNHLRIRNYLIGFSLCITLTLASFFIVVNQIFSGMQAFIVISTFALLQFSVQLLLFLHVGQEKKPKFNLGIFLYTAMTVIVIVIGTMWIMYNLDYNHSINNQTSPEEVEKYLIEEENINNR